jgi:hypothetical protein
MTGVLRLQISELEGTRLWSSIEPVSFEWVKVVGKTPRICRAACSYET